MSWPGEVSEKDGVRSPPRCSVTLILSDTSFRSRSKDCSSAEASLSSRNAVMWMGRTAFSR